MQTTSAHSWTVSIVLGLLGTVQYHRAQFTSRFDTFFGDRGDARGFVYFLEHWYQSLSGKGQLLSPGIFYPTKGTLAYSDLLVGFAFPYSLLRFAGIEMFSAAQILVIALGFATYLVCFVLLNKVLRLQLLASCAGAMFFAFSSPKFFQTGHLQLQFIIFIPAVFIFLILLYQQFPRLSSTRATIYLLLAVLCLLLQLSTAFYYAWFFALWTVLFTIPLLILPTSRRRLSELARKHAKPILFAAVFFLAGFVPVALLYSRTIRVGTWYSYQNVSEMIPSWWSILSLGDGNYVWGWLAAWVRPNPWPNTWGELMIGVGLVPSLVWLILTGYAAWSLVSEIRRPTDRAAPEEAQQKRARRAMLVALILATSAFFLLGFKYWNGQSPWYFVYRFFPGAGAIRAMSRYVIFLTLPMAIGLAYAAHVALEWASRKRSYGQSLALTGAILCLLSFAVIEQFGYFKVGATGFSKSVEEAYLKSMAAKLPPDCTAFYIASGKGKRNPAEYQYDAMMISIMTGIPTLNASSSQFPRDWELYHVGVPHYEANVKKWIESQRIEGKVCRVELNPDVEAFDPIKPQPLDDATFFVRQQYLDFLGREPTPGEIKAGVVPFQDCKPDGWLCNRDKVSFDLFHSTGFFDDGSFVYRMYQVAYRRAPRYDEFNADLGKLRSGGRQTLVEDFATRPEFSNRYSALTNRDYARRLIENTQVSIPNDVRDVLLDGRKARVEILLDLANSAEVSRAFTNRAFVTLHYFAYMRRDPDADGFANWLTLLNHTGQFQQITSGFISSEEYRLRFAAL